MGNSNRAGGCKGCVETPISSRRSSHGCRCGSGPAASSSRGCRCASQDFKAHKHLNSPRTDSNNSVASAWAARHGAKPSPLSQLPTSHATGPSNWDLPHAQDPGVASLVGWSPKEWNAVDPSNRRSMGPSQSRAEQDPRRPSPTATSRQATRPTEPTTQPPGVIPYDAAFGRPPRSCPPGRWWTSDYITCRCPGTGVVVPCISLPIAGWIGIQHEDLNDGWWCFAVSLAMLNKAKHPQLDLGLIAHELVSCIKAAKSDKQYGLPRRGLRMDVDEQRALLFKCKSIIAAKFGIQEDLGYSPAGGVPGFGASSPFRTLLTATKRMKPCKNGDVLVVLIQYPGQNLVGHMVKCRVKSCPPDIDAGTVELLCEEYPGTGAEFGMSIGMDMRITAGTYAGGLRSRPRMDHVKPMSVPRGRRTNWVVRSDSHFAWTPL